MLLQHFILLDSGSPDVRVQSRNVDNLLGDRYMTMREYVNTGSDDDYFSMGSYYQCMSMGSVPDSSFLSYVNENPVRTAKSGKEKQAHQKSSKVQTEVLVSTEEDEVSPAIKTKEDSPQEHTITQV